MLWRLVSQLITPARALIVSLAGAYMAWEWFQGNQWVSVITAAGAVAAGYVLDAIGEHQMRGHPVRAVLFMECWTVSSAAIAAVASAVAVIVTVALAVSDTDPTTTKELAAALTAGISAFVVGGFVSWAGEDKQSELADHIRQRFQKCYTSLLTGDDRGWVQGMECHGVEGWGRAARLARARKIQEILYPTARQKAAKEKRQAQVV